MSTSLTFTMVPKEGDQPKHSTRFNFEGFPNGRPTGVDDKFNPSFYIPKPSFRTAKRIRITIEEIG